MVAKTTGKSLRQPQLQEATLQPITQEAEFLALLEQAVYEESALENYFVRGLSCAELDCHGVAFYHVVFANCRFSACSFEKASFRQSVFRDCDLSNCNFSDSYWDCCTLEEIKGQGSMWQESSLHHLLLRHCQLRYANFTRAILETVQFQQCGLQEFSLSGCKLKQQCRWDQCDLSRADFFGTPLKNLDFSTCQLEGILLSDDYQELQGLTVNSLQAVELSKLLGLQVK